MTSTLGLEYLFNPMKIKVGDLKNNLLIGPTRTSHEQPRFDTRTMESFSKFEGHKKAFLLQILIVPLLKDLKFTKNILPAYKTGRILKVK